MSRVKVIHESLVARMERAILMSPLLVTCVKGAVLNGKSSVIGVSVTIMCC